MGKILVLEGPDGGGKTTLARRLVDATPGATLVHDGPPPVEAAAFKYYLDQVRAAGACPNPTVHDRLHVGQVVYPAVKRPYSEKYFGAYHRGLLDDAVAAAGGRVVLVLPPFGACLEAWKNKQGDYLETEAELWEVWHRFAAFSKQYHVVDRTSPGYETDVLELESWLGASS